MYYKTVLQDNEDLRKQIKKVSDQIKKLNIDKILEIENFIENASKIGVKEKFKNFLTKPMKNLKKLRKRNRNSK